MLKAGRRRPILHTVYIDRHVFNSIRKLHPEATIKRPVLNLFDQFVSIPIGIKAISHFLHIWSVHPYFHIFERLIVKFVSHTLGSWYDLVQGLSVGLVGVSHATLCKVEIDVKSFQI